MKKIILIYSIIFMYFQEVRAQMQLPENTPCAAICLDINKSTMNGKMPKANNLSVNKYPPCGGNTTEDNPTWFTFIPSGNSVTFDVAASNCIGVCNGLSLTLWEANGNCADLKALNCVSGTSGKLTTTVVPLNRYYLQLDGLCEAQCDVVLNYDKNQLVKTFEKPKLSGLTTICEGKAQKYAATFPISNLKTELKWKLEPLAAGTVIKIANTDSVTVRITNPPANGKIKLSVEPAFKDNFCNFTIQKETIDLEINDLKPASCSVSICPNEQPFSYNLSDCIKSANPTFKGITQPSSYTINLAAGTEKQEKINFIDQNSCASGTITLDIKVAKTTDTIKCNTCVAQAGMMDLLLPLLSTKNPKETIQALHKTNSATYSTTETFAYILHEGAADKIINPIASNKSGIFAFDELKMRYNQTYYVSFVVGKTINNYPDANATCYKTVPKGQAVVWFYK
jgi:hypothetical protein